MPRVSPFVVSPLYHPSQVLSTEEFQRLQTAAQNAGGERRNVVVLFADICDYTTLTQQVDPEDVFSLVNRYLGTLIEQVYQFGGVIDKFTGDGVMALFGAPIAHENDAERAVRATIEMQESVRVLNDQVRKEDGVNIAVRFGLHYGSVIFGQVGINLGQSLSVMDYTAIGDIVNLASRLQQAAEPGTALASQSIYDQTKALFEYQRIPSLNLKGYSRPVAAFKLVGLSAQPRRVRGLDKRQPPLIGRESEMAMVNGIIDDMVSNGNGRLLLITGEAGLGKSRLTTEIKRQIKHDITILEAESLSYRQSSSYWLFRKILHSYMNFTETDTDAQRQQKIRQRVIDLGLESDLVGPVLELFLSIPPADEDVAIRLQQLDAEQLYQQTFVAIHDILLAEAKQHPLMLILEDLHWVDHLSLEMIKFLTDIVPQAPLLLYCISRPAEGKVAETISKYTQTHFPEFFSTLYLEPLSSAHCQELLAALLAIPNLPDDLEQSIFTRAAGNPFYLEETIRMLIDENIIHQVGIHWELAPGASFDKLNVPNTLQGLVMTRFDRLPGDLQYILQVASVIGFRFSRRILKEIIPGDHLDEQLQLLEFQDFIIKLDDETENLYTFRHVITSETIYRSILRIRRSQIHGQVARAIEHLYRNRLAEQVETLATHYAKSHDQNRALYYLIRAGHKAARSFANSEALEFYQQALDILDKVDSTPAQSLDVLEGMGDVLAFVGEYESAKIHYQQAIYLLQNQAIPTNAHKMGALERKIAGTCFKQGNFDQALVYLAAALRQVKAGTGPLVRIEMSRICGDTGWVYLRRGNLEQAKDWFQKGLALIDENQHRDIAASIYNRLGGAYFQDDDWEEAAIWLGKSLEIQQTLGDLAGMARSHNNLGVMAARQGNLKQARYNLARSLKLRSQIGDTEGVLSTYLNLGAVLITLGDLERAEKELLQALDIADRIGHSFYRAMTHLNLGRLGIVAGKWETAIQHLNESTGVLAEIGAQDDLIDASYFMGEAWLGLGDLNQVERWGNKALELTRLLGSKALTRSFQKGRCQRLLGALWREKNDWVKSKKLLLESIAIFEASQNRLEQGKGYYELALLADRMGDHEQTIDYLQKADNTFSDLGAQLEQEKVEQFLLSIQQAQNDSID
ncbi:MAG: tetratricopeptide repeat protein [Anaerolineales bacterium]|nr:tetratricopeptide repeat protein [Anaerolineales bacterium]